MKLDEAVSTKCANRTGSGMYGLGSSSWEFITTANSNPIANAVFEKEKFLKTVKLTKQYAIYQHEGP